MTITIKSYLLDGDDFTALDDFQGNTDKINQLEQFEDGEDSWYGIDGYISMVVDGKEFLDSTYWDTLDDLYKGYVQEFPKVIDGEDVSFPFPDQAIDIKMICVGEDKLQLIIDDLNPPKEITVDKNEFIHAMINAAEEVFKLQAMFSNVFKNEEWLKDISALRKRLGKTSA